MKYFNVIVMMSLVISLIMNFILSSKIDQIENQLMNVTHYQQEIMSSVNGQGDHIRTVMNDIQKQQSWISEIQMDTNSTNIENGEMVARFDWQIKEWSDQSKVMFHYALGEQDTFTSIAAEDLQNGRYQVSIPLSLQLEPQWEIFLNSLDEEDTKHKMEEKRKEDFQQQTLKYFVSVTHGDVVKSSEIIASFVGSLGTEKYGVINVNVNFDQNHSSILVTTYQTHMLEKVQLLTYRNETLENEQELKAEYEHFILDEIKLNSEKRYVLKVTYKSGETFENVIYE